MTDKQQPKALRIADELEEPMTDFPQPTKLEAEAAAELRRLHAESEMRRTALLDEMQKAARLGAENETLRMGYAAARLEIESLQRRVLDAAFDAVRKKLCALPRYSFVLDDDGLIRRAQDRVGNWIEFDEAHALFDPVSVDAARKQGANHD